MMKGRCLSGVMNSRTGLACFEGLSKKWEFVMQLG